MYMVRIYKYIFLFYYRKYVDVYVYNMWAYTIIYTFVYIAYVLILYNSILYYYINVDLYVQYVHMYVYINITYCFYSLENLINSGVCIWPKREGHLIWNHIKVVYICGFKLPCFVTLTFSKGYICVCTKVALKVLLCTDAKSL